MLCTETETVREPDHHGGKDRGGQSKRNPVLAVMLLVAPVRRQTEPSLKDQAYCKAVSLAVPAIYEGVIDKLKENAWLAKTLAIEDTAERNAASASFLLLP